MSERATDVGHAEDATSTDVADPTDHVEHSASLRPQRDSVKRAREKQRQWAQDILNDSS